MFTSTRVQALAFAALLLCLTTTSSAQEHTPLTTEGQPVTALSGVRGTAPPVAQAVTSARLVRARAEPQNWLTYYGAYDGQRYSALDQINSGNVTHLKPAWIFQHGVVGLVATPATYSFEAAPIVVDGVMFVSGWDGWVWALEAATGQVLWQYKHAIPLDTPLCCGNVNRGVAVARGKVFVATANGHLLALDAVTGRPVWEPVVVDLRIGESTTVAPVVLQHMALVGNSGGEYGVIRRRAMGPPAPQSKSRLPLVAAEPVARGTLHTGSSYSGAGGTQEERALLRAVFEIPYLGLANELVHPSRAA